MSAWAPSLHSCVVAAVVKAKPVITCDKVGHRCSTLFAVTQKIWRTSFESVPLAPELCEQGKELLCLPHSPFPPTKMAAAVCPFFWHHMEPRPARRSWHCTDISMTYCITASEKPKKIFCCSDVLGFAQNYTA